MVLLTHPNVTVRPSMSLELNLSSNLTSTDAAKPKQIKRFFLDCLYALNSFQANVTLYGTIHLVLLQNFPQN